jgi:archaellum biogenesis protein FlaJ (TadC family)
VRQLWLLIPFGIISYAQNAAFTWSSRSRNSKDPSYHRYASLCSNGVYFLTNAALTLFIVKYQIWWMLALQGLVYTVTTAEGSVLMMKILLKREKGQHRVGNQFTEDEAASLRTLLSSQYDFKVVKEMIRRSDMVFVDGPPIPMGGQGAKQ